MTEEEEEDLLWAEMQGLNLRYTVLRRKHLVTLSTVGIQMFTPVTWC